MTKQAHDSSPKFGKPLVWFAVLLFIFFAGAAKMFSVVSEHFAKNEAQKILEQSVTNAESSLSQLIAQERASVKAAAISISRHKDLEAQLLFRNTFSVIESLRTANTQGDKISIYDFDGDVFLNPDKLEIPEQRIKQSIRGLSTNWVTLDDTSILVNASSPIGNADDPTGVLVVTRALDLSSIQEVLLPYQVQLTVSQNNIALMQTADIGASGSTHHAAKSRKCGFLPDGYYCKYHSASSLSNAMHDRLVMTLYVLLTGLLVTTIALGIFLFSPSISQLRTVVEIFRSVRKKQELETITLPTKGQLAKSIIGDCNGMIEQANEEIKSRTTRLTDINRTLERLRALVAVEDDEFRLFLLQADEQRKLCEAALNTIDSNNSQHLLERMSRFATTISSESKLFGLTHIFHESQRLTTTVARVRKANAPLSEMVLGDLKNNFNAICNEIDAYVQMRKEFLNRDVRNGLKVTVTETQVNWMISILKQLDLANANPLGNQKDLELISKKVSRLLSSLGKADIRDYLSRYTNIAEHWARESGRKIEPVSFSANRTFIRPDHMYVINNLIIQLLQNAIEHGIEPPKVRKLSGKNRSGQIRIDINQSESLTELVVRDDGRGIDIGDFKRECIKKGVLTAEAADKMELADLFKMFLEHKTKGNNASSRDGLGLINDVAGRAGGKIGLVSAFGVGTTFKCSIPNRAETLNDIVFDAAKTAQNLCRQIELDEDGTIEFEPVPSGSFVCSDYQFFNHSFRELLSIVLSYTSNNDKVKIATEDAEISNLPITRITLTIGETSGPEVIPVITRSSRFKGVMQSIFKAQGFFLQVSAKTGQIIFATQKNMPKDFHLDEVAIFVDCHLQNEISPVIKSWQTNLPEAVRIELFDETTFDEFMAYKGVRFAVTRQAVTDEDQIDPMYLNLVQSTIPTLIVFKDLTEKKNSISIKSTQIADELPISVWSLFTICSNAIHQNRSAFVDSEDKNAA